MSLLKKYYVYGLIVQYIFTAQLMPDIGPKRLRRRQHSLTKTLMGATGSQSGVNFVNFFLYTQPTSWMKNYNNLHLKLLLFLQCNFFKDYVDNEQILRDGKCKRFIL